ncbi:hypothetical protein [Paraliobacillus ryukyuensis]|uniref:hypothetical protein n=1 Tax=Paraliobacillus ryukyuensis TaxID=200904 RepID=UPI0009A6A565|nr:hypothetical protein [Paraliobacillus ryukyuensis]
MTDRNERTPLFNVRTTKMNDEMYDHVLWRIGEHGTFREYAFHLIKKDMDNLEREKMNKEKDQHVFDELRQLKHEMSSQFKRLNRKIEHKTFANSPVPEGESLTTGDKSRKVKEGQLVNEEPPTGEIEEDYNLDF